MGWPSVTPQRGAQLTGRYHQSVAHNNRSGTGRSRPHDLSLIERLRLIVHVGKGRRDRTLTRQAGVVGGSPGRRRGSAMGENNELDDDDSPGTGSSSWGGSNRWLPSALAAAGSGEIP